MKETYMGLLALTLQSCILLSPPKAMVRSLGNAPHYVCKPLVIRYLDPVPQIADDALRNAIVHWSLLLGVTPYIQVTQIESEEYEHLLRQYPIDVWIHITNTRAPWAQTVIYADRQGCVENAVIQLSRYAIDEGQEEITGLLAHELYQILGGPGDPETPPQGAVEQLATTTGGIAPLPWQQIPTLVDWLAIQYILQKNQGELEGPDL